MAENPPKQPPVKQPPAAQPPESTPERPPEGSMVIQAQYVKDLSFENPNAPAIFAVQSKEAPALNITLDVRPQLLSERVYEVVLCLRVQAKTQEKTAFLVELDYAGVVNIVDTVPEDEVKRLIMIEAPRYLFPFARGVLAMVTREGGFLPLVINPIDFEQFFAQNQKNAQTAIQTATAPA